MTSRRRRERGKGDEEGVSITRRGYERNFSWKRETTENDPTPISQFFKILNNFRDSKILFANQNQNG